MHSILLDEVGIDTVILEDLIDLHDIGQSVVWPVGIDPVRAKLILERRARHAACPSSAPKYPTTATARSSVIRTDRCITAPMKDVRLDVDSTAADAKSNIFHKKRRINFGGAATTDSSCVSAGCNRSRDDVFDARDGYNHWRNNVFDLSLNKLETHEEAAQLANSHESQIIHERKGTGHSGFDPLPSFEEPSAHSCLMPLLVIDSSDDEGCQRADQEAKVSTEKRKGF